MRYLNTFKESIIKKYDKKIEEFKNSANSEMTEDIEDALLYLSDIFGSFKVEKDGYFHYSFKIDINMLNKMFVELDRSINRLKSIGAKYAFDVFISNDEGDWNHCVGHKEMIAIPISRTNRNETFFGFINVDKLKIELIPYLKSRKQALVKLNLIIW